MQIHFSYLFILNFVQQEESQWDKKNSNKKFHFEAIKRNHR